MTVYVYFKMWWWYENPFHHVSVPVPDDGDTVSIEWHKRALKLEVRPNKQVVEELMSQTFAMRWYDNSYGLDTVFEKYHFLADISEVSLNEAFLLSV